MLLGHGGCDPAVHDIISGAAGGTNFVAPLAQVLHDL